MDDDNQYTHRADQHNQITIWFYNKFYSIENPNVSSFANDTKCNTGYPIISSTIQYMYRANNASHTR